MNGYTSISMSKDLSAILGYSGADMHWEMTYFSPKDGIEEYEEHPHFGYLDHCLPCWSLEALMFIVNQANIKDSYVEIDFDGSNGYFVYYNNTLTGNDEEYFYTVHTDDLVYACYRIIQKLNGSGFLDALQQSRN